MSVPSENENEHLGVAIFGAGRMGSIHIRHCFLHSQIKIKYLVEEDLSRAKELAGRYGFEDKVQIVNVSEAHRVYTDNEVNFVIICTPSFTHEPIVRDAIKAGKSVFCEKPLAPTPEQTKSCYQDAAANGVHLYCAFNRRYDPSQRNIFDQVMNGKLGKLRSICNISRDPPGITPIEYIKASGGILVDSVIHNIDTICSFTKEAPINVYATGHALHPDYAACGDVDTIVVVLNFPSGIKGYIEVSRNSCIGYDQRLEVFGEKGMLQMNNISQTTTVFTNQNGATSDPIIDVGFSRYMDSYRLELDHFVKVLQGKEELEVTSESTILVNEIVAASQKSLKTGLVVQLPMS